MAATKVFTIGEVLTASDLNGNFSKLPFASAAFRYTQVAAVAPNDLGTSVAVAFPASRFSVAPLVTVSTDSSVLTAYVLSVTSGTATINVRNNGNASSGANAVVTGFAVQMTSGTAAG
jgi:hypothetical protein